MKLNIRVPEWLCVPACIALIFLNAVSLSAKTNSATPAPKTHPATESSNAAVVNLADYGAVGDGVADDGPAFQSALDALADAGGGTLHVPAGFYLIKTPVIKDFS